MSSITTYNKAFLNELTRLVGHSHLLTEPAKTARYRKGFRSGQGDALAAGGLRPLELGEQLFADARQLARRLLANDPLRWVVLCSGYELGSQPGSWGPNVRTLLKPFELEELEQLLGGIHTALASVST